MHDWEHAFDRTQQIAPACGESSRFRSLAQPGAVLASHSLPCSALHPCSGLHGVEEVAVGWQGRWRGIELRVLRQVRGKPLGKPGPGLGAHHGPSRLAARADLFLRVDSGPNDRVDSRLRPIHGLHAWCAAAVVRGVLPKRRIDSPRQHASSGLVLHPRIPSRWPETASRDPAGCFRTVVPPSLTNSFVLVRSLADRSKKE